MSGTSCLSTDTACLCESDTFVTQVAACLASSCDSADQATGVTYGEEYCAASGYSIVIPDSASTVAGVSSVLASETAAASTTASTTSAATTTGTSSVKSTTSA